MDLRVAKADVVAAGPRTRGLRTSVAKRTRPIRAPTLSAAVSRIIVAAGATPATPNAASPPTTPPSEAPSPRRPTTLLAVHGSKRSFTTDQ